MKILVVDDDPVMLSLLENTLRYSGYGDITLAKTAEDAAQTIARASPPYDCMFFDMKMPGVDGDELCYWVRELPEYEKTPILMVTGMKEKTSIDRAFAAGATDYFTKPLNLPDFIFKVDQIKLGLKKEIYKARKQADLQMPTETSDRVAFTDPFVIGKIPCEVTLDAMEQYIRRLNKQGIRDMDAFAFAIKDAAKLHFLCPKQAYVSILRATGMIISKYLPSTSPNFLAYAGYGAFVGVAQGLGQDEGLRDAIEHNVQQKLASLHIPTNSGNEMGVVPFMSLPHRLNFTKSQTAVDTLYRSMVDAEERCRPALAVA